MLSDSFIYVHAHTKIVIEIFHAGWICEHE